MVTKRATQSVLFFQSFGWLVWSGRLALKAFCILALAATVRAISLLEQVFAVPSTVQLAIFMVGVGAYTIFALRIYPHLLERELCSKLVLPYWDLYARTSDHAGKVSKTSRLTREQILLHRTWVRWEEAFLVAITPEAWYLQLLLALGSMERVERLESHVASIHNMLVEYDTRHHLDQVGVADTTEEIAQTERELVEA